MTDANLTRHGGKVARPSTLASIADRSVHEIGDALTAKLGPSVAALYVDVARGPYAAMEGVDAWGIERDAKLYAGPHPVVAHPPCGPWGVAAPLCWKQDPDCGPRAVGQVREWCGVMEHPRHSKLWQRCGLPVPGGFPLGDGFAIEVQQVRWGHKAIKPTWLYVVGCEPCDLPPIPPWREPTHVLGFRCRSEALPGLNSTTRHLTPPAFAEWLVAVANTCRKNPQPEDQP